MWACKKCGRIFEKKGQIHSCRKVPLERHFQNKEKAKEIFDYLFKQINDQIGKCQIISLPCCIHFFGKNDFLAALPKRNGLEIRISLGRILKSPNLKQGVPMSSKVFKNCFMISSEEEIDQELFGWIRESFNLKS